MIKSNPKNGIGSKLEPVLRIRYSEMAIPTSNQINAVFTKSNKASVNVGLGHQ